MQDLESWWKVYLSLPQITAQWQRLTTTHSKVPMQATVILFARSIRLQQSLRNQLFNAVSCSYWLSRLPLPWKTLGGSGGCSRPVTHDYPAVITRGGIQNLVLMCCYSECFHCTPMGHDFINFSWSAGLEKLSKDGIKFRKRWGGRSTGGALPTCLPLLCLFQSVSSYLIRRCCVLMQV
jgi:hypothetical protein